jgi:hypothetical protein
MLVAAVALKEVQPMVELLVQEVLAAEVMAVLM